MGNMEYKLGQVGIIGKGKLLLGTMYTLSAVQQFFFFFFNIMNKYVWGFFLTWHVTLQVSIHSVWLGNNITPLREEEWGEDEEDEADTPAPTSPPLSPINSRLVK